jgi:hypothetical protein
VKDKRLTYLLIYLSVCVASLSFFHSDGTLDVGAWLGWAENAEQYGLVEGYRANWDMYPPVAPVIVFAFAKLSHALGIETFFGVKLSLFIFLLLTALLSFIWTRDPLIPSLTQLALTLNSMALGYIDIYFASPLILALWALRRRNWFLATLCFTLTCLIKFQPGIIAPFIVLYVLGIRKLEDVKNIDLKGMFLSAVLPLLAIGGLVFAVFGVEIVRAFERATEDWFLSGQALNFNWIVTHFLHVFFPEEYGPLIDGHAIFVADIDPRIMLVPRLIFYAFYAYVLFGFFRREKTFKNLLLFSLAGYMAYFTFNTGVHENHLFLASLLGLALYWVDRDYLPLTVAIIVAANLNPFFFYGIEGQHFPFKRVVGVDLALVLSVLNVALFFVVFRSVVGRREEGTTTGVQTSAPDPATGLIEGE